MSNIDKRALREAAEKATALNLDTAQETRLADDECIECPNCGGDGYMEVQRDYCNIDGVALGVLFYGIGEHHGLAEAFFRAANPATVLALLDELEAKDRRIEEEIGRANREHHRGFMMACGHLKEHSNVHYADAAEMEIAALRKRINELENAAAGKGE